jgi:transcriptional regulator with XRE-family HTH domain
VPAVVVSSGVAGLDGLLGGGLLQGDNVVWVVGPGSAYLSFRAAFVASSRAVRPTFVVGPDDAVTADPTTLTAELRAVMDRQPVTSIVVDGYAELVARWGADAARDVFVRTCPAMLQAGAVTYWELSPDLPASLIEACRQVTQCLLELDATRLRVVKAEGRARSLQDSVHTVHVLDGEVEFRADPAHGRLARGLTRLRRDLGLTQAQLAAAAGVSASAISQAESGGRGLSVDTLVTLSDRLGISLDRLMGTDVEPGYRLTRHDRSRERHGVVALADDARTGLRAFHVRLDGHERRQPPRASGLPQLVAVVEGLVQVQLGDDTPVLRGGDSLLAESVAVGWWQNLRGEPAALYWVVRD